MTSSFCFGYQDSRGLRGSPLHVALIADPQLTDEYTYNFPQPLQYITELYSDMYMASDILFFPPGPVAILRSLTGRQAELSF